MILLLQSTSRIRTATVFGLVVTPRQVGKGCLKLETALAWASFETEGMFKSIVYYTIYHFYNN